MRVALATTILMTGITLSGCATYTSVETAQRGERLLFSGTRLDSCALTDNQVCLKTFNTKPPQYPLLDLPASFILDTILLPYTLLHPLL